MRWIRERARPRAHARVDTGFDVAREHVHDPAERRGAVQRRARPFHDLHALHVLERDQVPVDAAAVALVRGDAVHQQEHARAEALHVAGRAADVHLAVQELHAGGLVHRFVHGGDGAAGELGVGDHRDAGDRLVEQLGALGGGHDDGLRDERRGGQGDVDEQRLSRLDGQCIDDVAVSDAVDVQDDLAGTHWCQPKAPGAVGQRSQVRPGRPNPRVLNRSACRVCDGAGDDCSLAGERLRPEQDERPRPRCGPSPPVEEREWECGTDGPQRNGGAGK